MNCSFAACIASLPASKEIGSNASLNEQKNAKNKHLQAILPHVSQDTAHDLLQMHMMLINEEQLIDNMLEESRLGVQRKPDSAPTFVVDGINLTRIANLTHYQRDCLENGRSTVRQHNPNSNKKRMMIAPEKYRKFLKMMCAINPKSGDFVSCTYCQDAQNFVSYLRQSRPALFNFLKFSYTDDRKKIQIHSDLISLHELFRHWSCRNHETTLIFPSAGQLLKPFTNRRSFTEKHYNEFRNQVPGLLLSLVDYGIEQIPKDTPQILPETIRDLLKLSISLAKADTSIIGNVAAFLEQLTNTCHSLYPNFCFPSHM